MSVIWRRRAVVLTKTNEFPECVNCTSCGLVETVPEANVGSNRHDHRRTYAAVFLCRACCTYLRICVIYQAGTTPVRTSARSIQLLQSYNLSYYCRRESSMATWCAWIKRSPVSGKRPRTCSLPISLPSLQSLKGKQTPWKRRKQNLPKRFQVAVSSIW